MRILITDGYKKTDFLLEQICSEAKSITLVHEDKVFAQKMLEKYDIDVFVGNASTPSVMQSLETEVFDVLICLSNSDARNYVICKLAHKKIEVKKRVSLISNPNNQKTFKQLGIAGAISASHLIANIIKRFATFKETISFIELEESEVKPYEVKIEASFSSIGKQLRELVFPDSCIVCCIMRDGQGIIPNGQDIIKCNDRVVIFTKVKNTDTIDRVFV